MEDKNPVEVKQSGGIPVSRQSNSETLDDYYGIVKKFEIDLRSISVKESLFNSYILHIGEELSQLYDRRNPKFFTHVRLWIERGQHGLMYIHKRGEEKSPVGHFLVYIQENGRGLFTSTINKMHRMVVIDQDVVATLNKRILDILGSNAEGVEIMNPAEILARANQMARQAYERGGTQHYDIDLRNIAEIDTLFNRYLRQIGKELSHLYGHQNSTFFSHARLWLEREMHGILFLHKGEGGIGNVDHFLVYREQNGKRYFVSTVDSGCELGISRKEAVLTLHHGIFSILTGDDKKTEDCVASEVSSKIKEPLLGNIDQESSCSLL